MDRKRSKLRLKKKDKAETNNRMAGQAMRETMVGGNNIEEYRTRGKGGNDKFFGPRSSSCH